MPGSGGSVTRLLSELREGNQEAANQLVPLVYAAHTMRQVLVEYARRRHAGKRGGMDARKVDIDAELFIAECNLEDVIAIDEVLERLALIDPRQSRLIELRFFAGLNLEEAAEVMGVSPTTLKREWRLAKAWLGRELSTAKSG